MSAKEGPSEQEDGTIRIPVAKFIDSVDDYLSSRRNRHHLTTFTRV